MVDLPPSNLPDVNRMRSIHSNRDIGEQGSVVSSTLPRHSGHPL